MRVPTEVTIDREYGLAVLQYGDSSSRRSLPIGHELVFDLGENNELLDIEFLAISEAILNQASVLASAYYCEIPAAIRNQLLHWNLTAA